MRASKKKFALEIVADTAPSTLPVPTMYFFLKSELTDQPIPIVEFHF